MHICIVGGGISGLYSALLLQRLGHKVTIYEASSRLGGRIYTHHFDSPDNHAYFEAGAMRIPCSPLHADVFNLIRYINTNGPPDSPIGLIPYILETRNNISYIAGQKSNIFPAGDDPELSARLGLPKEFHGTSARELLARIISPWLQLLEKDFDSGFEEIVKYDDLSFRQYLRIVAGWPHEVVDFLETMLSQSNQYDLSFTEIVMQNLDFNTSQWATIKGGMSNLITAASSLVGLDQIYLNSKATSILPLPNPTGGITIQTSNQSIPPTTFSAVILAIPPAALHTIRSRPLWSPQKEQALRSLHYEPLYKMGLHFKTRFWEHGSNPCFGGQSTTDLRFRWIVYPSNDLGSDKSGVLLLYCWMNDALRWTALTPQERINLALHDLSIFFKDYKVKKTKGRRVEEGDTDYEIIDIHDQFISSFDISYTTTQATGDAMFLPGQITRYHSVLSQSENNHRIFFAGEHLSKHHTWIAGALDSSLRAVRDVVGDGEERVVRALGSEIGAGRRKEKGEESEDEILGLGCGEKEEMVEMDMNVLLDGLGLRGLDEGKSKSVEMATGIKLGKGRKVDTAISTVRKQRNNVDMDVF